MDFLLATVVPDPGFDWKTLPPLVVVVLAAFYYIRLIIQDLTTKGNNGNGKDLKFIKDVAEINTQCINIIKKIERNLECLRSGQEAVKESFSCIERTLENQDRMFSVYVEYLKDVRDWLSPVDSSGKRLILVAVDKIENLEEKVNDQHSKINFDLSIVKDKLSRIVNKEGK